jgi:hypothetical protein
MTCPYPVQRVRGNPAGVNGHFFTVDGDGIIPGKWFFIFENRLVVVVYKTGTGKHRRTSLVF